MEVLPRDSLPNKIRWSQRAVARHLCSDKATVKVYAETIATVIPDYLRECPRNPDGSVQSGLPLSQYQCWVVCQLITLGRAIKTDLNGTAYRKVVKSTAIKKSHLLSKAAYVRQAGSEDIDETLKTALEKISPVLGKLEEASDEIVDNSYSNGSTLDLSHLERLMQSLS